MLDAWTLAAGLLAADSTVEMREGGIVRGPRGEKRIALEFTGHEFAEGADVILDALARRGAEASFFLTGDFLRRPEFAPVVARMRDEGHYLGPHSDKHLLYCGWGADKPTLLDREAFARDLGDNLRALEAHGIARTAIRHWVPAYEHYNAEISRWSDQLGIQVVNFTPGTRSNADYTGEADSNYVSSEHILRSILEREAAGPDGLNGFLLLMHIGAGPGRRDKMHHRIGELLDRLSDRGYAFVRVDMLLEKPPAK